MATAFLELKNIKPNDPAVKLVADKLQGNILEGHGRDHTVHLFFKFTGTAAANKALAKTLATHVTSMAQQLADKVAFREKNETTRPFCNLFVTAKGYKALGFTDAQLATAFPEPPATPFHIDPQIQFKKSMAGHVAELADPPTSTWEPGYAATTGGPNIDGMVLLANDSKAALEFAEWDMRRILVAAATVVAAENGLAIFNADKSQNLEHFGYVDGRSQPTYFQHNQDKEHFALGGISSWDPAEPLKRVLVPDALAPTGEATNCFGSYFVFRKLEQNVRGFKEKEQELANALGLIGEAREVAGAYAVGRFEDGTPVAVRDTDGLRNPVPNNFAFGGPGGADPSGSKCPFHAHIRKMSPRGDTANNPDDEFERSHRITRRGITYGQRTVEPKDDPNLDDMPTGGVGLLFMCFQSNIDNQFGFMQRAWANNANFVKPATGIDPVIGQPVGIVPVEQKWPNPYGTANGATFGFESFVTMKGGEFFFCPSIPFLKSL